ncbi:uncharacterized protein FA14DRAFT_178165 [Meira miltonrushii]|uniref:Uncharacterized protein n=1 Tax=Meira miltonrushii TaxID=1280837 RepID=A0A316VAX1_9BASI|nr:uncharacterized protein FA14DRAFT_178165 [Meira miltonrushii]PWN34767.1 hypothetical protein FA14DRAFT_178165 [Meira miltonrushii]
MSAYQQQQSQSSQNGGQLTPNTQMQQGILYPMFNQVGMNIQHAASQQGLSMDAGSSSQPMMAFQSGPHAQHFAAANGHMQVNPFISNVNMSEYPASFMGFGGQMYVGDSGEYDDSMGLDDDSADWMELSDDPVIQAKLRIVQQAQQAASEGNTGIFSCPYCDKQYAGKHARSIWRRHLQDKHFIPLSQQPRRTRWDGNANRPKNAEERRERMLESKRRWARKRRLQDKAASGNGDVTGDASTNAGSPEDGSKSDAETEAATGLANEEVMSRNSPALEKQKFAMANTVMPNPKKRTMSGNGEKKPRGMQTLKFHHHMTTTSMPHYADNHNAPSSGAITAVWPAINGAKAHMNGGASSRNFSKHASMPIIPPQSTTAMFSTVTSPRQPLAEVNRDSKLRRLSFVDSNQIKSRSKKKGSNAGLKGQEEMIEAGGLETQAHNYPMKSTPVNRYSTLYPTPPSVGDDRSLVAQVFGGNGERIQNGNVAGLLSPPASQRTLESSPSFVSSATKNGTYNGSISNRHSASSMLSPVSSSRRVHQSPASNPFSLDRHKISPSTSNAQRTKDAALEAPASSSRLSSALGKDIKIEQNQDENRLSPLQTRVDLSHSGKDGYDVLNGSSPVMKSRRLPPLVKTPLRSALLDGVPTPANGTSMAMPSLASASVQRITRGKAAANGLTGATPSLKGMSATTPTQHDRMMGSANILGLTPFDVRNSSKYSATRSQLFSRASPLKRDANGKGNDQFSSPQHLNLTQSLGLAPHSTGKGTSLLTSLTGTPFAGNTFMSMNSPWPDSILRPSFRTSASKRGGAGFNGDDDEEGGMDALDTPAAARLLDNSDEVDEDDGQMGMQETPSRPDKNKRLASSMLGSPTSASQQRSVTRSQQGSAQKNGLLQSNGKGSSAGRSQRSQVSRRTSDHQPPLPVLSFKLSSPAPLLETSDEEEEHGHQNKRRRGSLQDSFDSELMRKEPGSPTTDLSTSSVSSLRGDIRDEDNVEDSI